MLRAILGNKAGRVTINGQSVSVREIYKEREDMLTAAIISRVGYLSDAALNNLFNFIFESSRFDFHLLNEIEFWPSFSSSIQHRVEPDVILHFEWGIIVIEAKRPHNSFQDAKQWIKELESLPTSYREKEIYFLSLGGSSINNINELKRFERLIKTNANISLPESIIMTYQTWEGLINHLQAIKDSGELNRSDGNIIADMIEALELYHVHANLYSLSSLKPLGINTLSKNLIATIGGVCPNTSPSSQLPVRLRDLPIETLNWPKSAETISHLKAPQQSWPVSQLCNINEQLIKPWKI